MSRYLPSIKRYSWIVVAVVLLAALGGGILIHAMGPENVVSSTLVVEMPTSGVAGGALLTNPATSIAQANVFAAEVTSRSAMTFVEHSYPELGKHGHTIKNLMQSVTATPSTSAGTITIQATGRTSTDALMMANDVAQGFTAFVAQQGQQENDAIRSGLENQLKQFQDQKSALETKIQHTQYSDKSTTSGATGGNSATNSMTTPGVNAASQASNHGWTSSTTTTIVDPQLQVDMADLASLNQGINAIQTQIATLSAATAGSVAIIQLAAPADVAPSAKPLLVLAALLLMGLIIGLLLAGLMMYLDRRLVAGDMVKERLGQSFVGDLSTDATLAATPARPALRAAQQSANIYASLCLMGFAQMVHPERRGSVLLVTSAREGEGKTTLACAIAGAVARAGTSVVLVDANLRRPTDHLSLGVTPTGSGLSGLLAGEGTVGDAVQETDIPNLQLLPAGSAVEVPTLLLQDNFPEVLRQVSQLADVVIVDGPEMLASADGVLLANVSDQVMLVVDARHDQLPQIERAVELLSSLTHTQVGVVLNRAPNAQRDGYFASAQQPKMLAEHRVPSLAAAGGLQPLAIGPAANGGNGLAELGIANHALPETSPESPVI